MKLCSNSCPIKQLAASLSHSFMGGFPRVPGKGAGCICNDKDVVSLLNQAKGREGDANFGQNTTARR